MMGAIKILEEGPVRDANPLDRRSRIAAARIGTAAVVALAGALAVGCGSEDSESGGGGGSAEEIKIGLPAALTGPGAAFAKPESDGAQMVADAINASGGIKELGGAKIRLIIKDTQSDPTIAAKNLRELAQQENVSAFLGPVISPEVVANKPLIQSLKIPTFTPSGDKVVTEGNENGYIFRTLSQTAKAAEETVAYIGDLVESGELEDVKTVGVVATSIPPGVSVSPVLMEGLPGVGLEPTLFEYDPTQVKDFAPLISKLRSANVDLVMGFQSPPDALLFAEAMNRQDWRPKGGFFWTNGAHFQDGFRKEAGDVINGWVVAGFSSNLESDTYSPETQQMAADFQEEYGVTMEGSGGAIGATFMTVAANAIAAAKSTDPEKIAAAARELNFTEPTGSTYPYYMLPGGVEFDEEQNNSAIVTPFIQWLPEGGFETVGPEDIATGELAPQGPAT
jgi:branched-chain amino acid transport system substrate-binding protein